MAGVFQRTAGSCALDICLTALYHELSMEKNMSHYDFFQNRECEYFPCHVGADPETFSCLFCYCPLYCLGERCEGSFRYTAEGIKDCSACLRPHKRENYEDICRKMREVMDIVKRK